MGTRHHTVIYLLPSRSSAMTHGPKENSKANECCHYVQAVRSTTFFNFPLASPGPFRTITAIHRLKKHSQISQTHRLNDILSPKESLFLPLLPWIQILVLKTSLQQPRTQVHPHSWTVQGKKYILNRVSHIIQLRFSHMAFLLTFKKYFLLNTFCYDFSVFISHVVFQ